MTRKKQKWAVVALFGFLILGSSLSFGQSLGISAGRYTDMKKNFLGLELLSRLSPNTCFNPNLEYVFIDNFTYMTFNFDFHYDFYMDSALFFWLGAGLGVLYSDPNGPSNSNTDLGANVMFGIGIKTLTSLTPYFQGKFILADNNEFVLKIGLRF